jgi:hypothetical protein
MMIDRAIFEAVGGFRALVIPGPEDQMIQQDITDAGGVLYRTHGLGYVLRRSRSGHTWQADVSYFTNEASRSWSGLHLSAMFGR